MFDDLENFVKEASDGMINKHMDKVRKSQHEAVRFAMREKVGKVQIDVSGLNPKRVYQAFTAFRKITKEGVND